jgi:hypothetical protein
MNNGASGVKALSLVLIPLGHLKKYVCLILPLQTRMKIIMGELIFPLVVQDHTPKGFQKKNESPHKVWRPKKEEKKSFFLLLYMKGEVIHGLNKNSFNWHWVC